MWGVFEKLSSRGPRRTVFIFRVFSMGEHVRSCVESRPENRPEKSGSIFPELVSKSSKKPVSKSSKNYTLGGQTRNSKFRGTTGNHKVGANDGGQRRGYGFRGPTGANDWGQQRGYGFRGPTGANDGGQRPHNGFRIRGCTHRPGANGGQRTGYGFRGPTGANDGGQRTGYGLGPTGANDGGQRTGYAQRIRDPAMHPPAGGQRGPTSGLRISGANGSQRRGPTNGLRIGANGGQRLHNGFGIRRCTHRP